MPATAKRGGDGRERQRDRETERQRDRETETDGQRQETREASHTHTHTHSHVMSGAVVMRIHVAMWGAESGVQETMELLHRGNLNRSVEPTKKNETSSRSHAIMQIMVAHPAARRLRAAACMWLLYPVLRQLGPLDLKDSPAV
eukprot:2626074-Rhodomonas_salina.1